uniref:(northern house mosquito) hypothetical protein n=1 Tax=Culex pipiens TaxID=7175 RepID=A0A8D8C8J4_CULPI
MLYDAISCSTRWSSRVPSPDRATEAPDTAAPCCSRMSLERLSSALYLACIPRYSCLLCSPMRTRWRHSSCCRSISASRRANVCRSWDISSSASLSASTQDAFSACKKSCISLDSSSSSVFCLSSSSWFLRDSSMSACSVRQMVRSLAISSCFFSSTEPESWSWDSSMRRLSQSEPVDSTGTPPGTDSSSPRTRSLFIWSSFWAASFSSRSLSSFCSRAVTIWLFSECFVSIVEYSAVSFFSFSSSRSISLSRMSDWVCLWHCSMASTRMSLALPLNASSTSLQVMAVCTLVSW